MPERINRLDGGIVVFIAQPLSLWPNKRDVRSAVLTDTLEPRIARRGLQRSTL